MSMIWKIVCTVFLLGISGFGAVMLLRQRGTFDKKKNRPTGSEPEPENSFAVDDLIVGKRYAVCQSATAGDASGKTESTDENSSTFAGQDVRSDEPGTREQGNGAKPEEHITDADGTDSKEQTEPFSYELILVDGDPMLDEYGSDYTRRVLPSRPVIPVKDTGKILDELIWDDQPEFEADASESERKEMESFDMEDFS